MRIRQTFERIVKNLYDADDTHEGQRRLIIIFLAIGLLIVLVSLPLTINAPQRSFFYGFVGLLLIALVFALRNQLWPGKIIAPTAGFAFITWLIYLGGVHDDAIGGYYFILIVVGLLLGQRALIAFGVMSTVAIVLIGFAETNGLISTYFGPLTEPTTVATSAFFMLGTTLALRFLVSRLNRAAKNAHRHELALTSTNLELRELQSVLEHRVQQRTSELDYANQQLQTQIERINSLQEKLREDAIRDSLTGLFNRRYLDAMIPIEIASAKRTKIPITILVMDLDHFKSINDTHGHQVGDGVLQAIGNTLRMNIRAGDIACRYGGEEFVLVLPGMKNGDAKTRAEILRARIEAQLIGEKGRELKVTVSIGAAVYPDDGDSRDGLISVADNALYRAKQNGRNRVEFHQG